MTKIPKIDFFTIYLKFNPFRVGDYIIHPPWVDTHGY